jgi:hypothetical protein
MVPGEYSKIMIIKIKKLTHPKISRSFSNAFYKTLRPIHNLAYFFLSS